MNRTKPLGPKSSKSMTTPKKKKTKQSSNNNMKNITSSSLDIIDPIPYNDDVLVSESPPASKADTILTIAKGYVHKNDRY
jgi:hypothetical protein